MAGALETYNPQVLAVACPKCGAPRYERCKNQLTTRPIKAHAGRIKLANAQGTNE